MTSTVPKVENDYNTASSAHRQVLASTRVDPRRTDLMIKKTRSDHPPHSDGDIDIIKVDLDDDVPGEPAKRARAGTTVLGGITVLSAILAQSLIIVNFP